MKIRKMDHVGIVVNDLPAAKAFFLDLGFESQGEGEAEGAWLDTIVGLKGVRTAVAMLQTPGGQAKIELIKFYTPSDENGVQPQPANTLGIRHIAFIVEDIEAVDAPKVHEAVSAFSKGILVEFIALQAIAGRVVAKSFGGRIETRQAKICA